jgi:lipopolysaccharide export system permease protein
VPVANHRAEMALTQALKQDKPTFNTENIIKPIFKDIEVNGKKQQVLDWLFYAEKFDGKTMTGVTVIDKSQRDNKSSQIVNADSAIFDIKQGVWIFNNATTYSIEPNAAVANIIKIQDLKLKLPRSPLDFAAPDKNPEDMSISEAMDYAEEVRMGGDKKKILSLDVKIQSKLAFPFICLVFGLIGSSMGIRPQRTGKATSFGVSVLLIFGYYLLMFVCAALGQAEVISPFLAGWLPNLIGIASGGWSIAQAAKK